MADHITRSETAGVILSVAVPVPLDTTFDYRWEGECPPLLGSFIQVPFGNRRIHGVVWAVGGDTAPDRPLKFTGPVVDLPPLTESMRRFVEWVAGYTMTPLGAVLRMVMSVPDALKPPTPAIGYVAIDPIPEDLRVTSARRRVLDQAGLGVPHPAAELARLAGVGPGVVKGLVTAGALAERPLALDRDRPQPDPGHPGPRLSPAQRTAAAALVMALKAQEYRTLVIDGVPGSGKTEVYFEAVVEVLRGGGQVLVLLPEIALSAQWLERFGKRFGAPPDLWHSDMSAAQRRQTWRRVAEGRARVVIGARSALFLPFPELRLIVVDEEHDPSYKQDEGVIYHGRDMAVLRARLAGLPAVLASATPSLETVVNGRRGRYDWLHLPERHGGAELPELQCIDLRREPPPRGRWVAPVLWREVEDTLERGEQAMLFINRRGYAPLTLCRQCGHRFQCPSCSAWLVEHRMRDRLICHHCGHGIQRPDSCPECGAADSLVACGPGIERLAEEVRALLPEARVFLASSDTLRGPSAAADMVRAMESGEVDLILGTQLVAKGYHFPRLTLVGVVDGDLGLSGGDLRAVERTYQLLFQVAGRAGRSDLPGRVLIQTYHPDSPMMRALLSGERETFLTALVADREAGGMPPFGRLVSLIVSGPNESRVDETARRLGRAAPRGDDLTVLGPAPAALALLRGQYRRRLLLRTDRQTRVQPLVRDWLRRAPPAKGVRVRVDVDPQSFL